MTLNLKGKFRSIVEEPDPRLHQKSSKVNEVNEEIRQLMADMVYSMTHCPNGNGIGLSAVQVGVMLDVIVVAAQDICGIDKDSALDDIKDKYLYMANAEIVEHAQEKCSYNEACLSYPGLGVDIERPRWAKFSYIDENNVKREISARGLLARCIMHEMDHARGRVIADYLSPLKRSMALKKFAKRAKEKTKLKM